MIGRMRFCFGAWALAAGLFATSASAQPYSFTGRGQQATQFFNLDKGLTTFNFRNVGRSNFVVWLLDHDGNRIALVANEIGSCDGSKAVRIDRAESYLLDISADGQWAISRSVMIRNPFVPQPGQPTTGTAPSANATRSIKSTPEAGSVKQPSTGNRVSGKTFAESSIVADYARQTGLSLEESARQLENEPIAKRYYELELRMDRLKQRTEEASNRNDRDRASPSLEAEYLERMAERTAIREELRHLVRDPR